MPLSPVGIKVSWRPPPAAQHGGLIQGYKVLYTPQLRDLGKFYVWSIMNYIQEICLNNMNCIFQLNTI